MLECYEQVIYELNIDLKCKVLEKIKATKPIKIIEPEEY